jgi:hypothetical protein
LAASCLRKSLKIIILRVSRFKTDSIALTGIPGSDSINIGNHKDTLEGNGHVKIGIQGCKPPIVSVFFCHYYFTFRIINSTREFHCENFMDAYCVL